MTNNRSLAPVFLVYLLLSPIVWVDAQAEPDKAGTVPSPFVKTFSPSEWTRLTAIGEQLQHTQMLSDSDMDFVSQLLRTPPPQNSVKEQEKRQMVVLGKLISSRPKVLTPVQRQHLFNVVLPYTDSPGIVVRTNAMIVIASSRDPRAVAVLERHVKTDKNPQNRTIAADFLNRLRLNLKPPVAR